MATSNFTSFLSQLSRRTKIWLSVWLLSVLCGVLVICCPSIFYTDLLRDRDEAGNDRHLILTNIEHDLSSQELYADIQDARRTAARQRSRVNEINSRKPIFGSLSAYDQGMLDKELGLLDAYQQDLHALTFTHQKLLAHRRALSPVFSQLAFEEARTLFYERQTQGREMSYRAWMWNMLFSAGRHESMGQAIVSGIIRLVWNMTFGAMIALVDFAIRLPFWIKEYELFNYEGAGGEHELMMQNMGKADKHQYRKDSMLGYEGEEGEEGEEASNEREKGLSKQYNYYADLHFMQHSSSTYSSYLNALAFYFVAMSGAIGGTFLMIGVIWTPLLLLGYLVYQHAKRNGGIRVNMQRGGMGMGRGGQFGGSAAARHPHYD